MTPNRITAGAVALLGILTGLAGLAADLGAPAQVAAIIAGAILLLTPAVVWLRGWQAWEARQGEADQPVDLKDLREAVDLLLKRYVPAYAGPDAAGERTDPVAELGYLASRLTDALASSRPAAPVQAGGVAVAPAPVREDELGGVRSSPQEDEEALAQALEAPPEDVGPVEPEAVEPAERGAP